MSTEPLFFHSVPLSSSAALSLTHSLTLFLHFLVNYIPVVDPASVVPEFVIFSMYDLQLLLQFFLLTAAAGQQNVFYFPGSGGPTGDYSQDLIFPIGSTQQIRWSTSYTNLSLVLYKDGDPSFEYLQSMYPFPRVACMERWMINLLNAQNTWAKSIHITG